MVTPVLIVDYEAVLYTPHEEQAMALEAMHMWAQWFPDHFIILTCKEGDD